MRVFIIILFIKRCSTVILKFDKILSGKLTNDDFLSSVFIFGHTFDVFLKIIWLDNNVRKHLKNFHDSLGNTTCSSYGKDHWRLLLWKPTFFNILCHSRERVLHSFVVFIHIGASKVNQRCLKLLL